MGLYRFLNDLFGSRPDLEDERLIPLTEDEIILRPGIHGNRECIQCGTCCVCYHIEFPDGSEKRIGKVCQYLDYNLEAKIASCRIHDEGPSIRPIECIDYKYCAKGFWVRLLDTWIQLQKTAPKMPKIMEREIRKRNKIKSKKKKLSSYNA